MVQNTLIIVGTGIKFMSHLTTEAKASIEQSDKVFYLLNDPLMEEWVKQTNTSSESLDFLYLTDQHRSVSYNSIADYVIDSLNKYGTVCFVTYGHPTVLDHPALIASNKAIEKNYNVTILPAISAEDCLYADLKIDPMQSGCQSFEATDLLVYQRDFDSSSHLIIWQASVIGVTNQPLNHDPRKGLSILTSYLSPKYSMEHEVIIYEAAQYPNFHPKIERTSLGLLAEHKISRKSTLYIPPAYQKLPDKKLIEKLKSII